MNPGIFFRAVISKFLNFLKEFFPANRAEGILFLFFFLIYGCIAFYIAQNFNIIFNDKIPWDAYFSFDNRSIILTGGGFERHPLSNYYFGWLRDFALWISEGKKDAAFRTVLALCSSVSICLTNVQIFKYLKNIIGLPLLQSLLLVLLFGSFVTPLLLSFTPETYTYTLLALTAFNYYAAMQLRNDKKLAGSALILGSTVIGGLTITNIVKVFIPVLFEKNLFRSWKKIGSAVFRTVISAGIFIFLFLNRLNFKYEMFFSKTESQYEKFSKAADFPLWDMICSWFFGGNILFSGFILRDYHNIQKTFYYKALFMDVYQSWVPYLFVGVIYLMVLWSYFKNFKNKLVQILMLSFLADVVIHVILRFGLHTAYIYGGHFVFMIPWMLGWLFFAYRNQPRMMSLLTSVLLVTFIYFISCNIYRFTEFLTFLGLYYS